ncbi:PREDICTED: tetraspanin-32 [Myotis brandtii]|uniref:tetraspanin-32 n=1 Tax=Myotis brandtii TaxID=109478 RepID=UPI0007041BE3|nr:PREDICTED: tetraspanin-32 [Myotis brandtii]
MGPRSRVRVAKCQMLVTCLFVLLLGLLAATMAALTYFGAHFAVFSRVSPEGSSYPALHRGAFFAGISLAGILTLGAVLSAENGGKGGGGRRRHPPGRLRLRLADSGAGGGQGRRGASTWGRVGPCAHARVWGLGFLCFALVFCALVQGAFWRLRNPTQVEDALLDTYDLVYDQAFLCCGKTSPSGLLGSAEAELCRGQEAATQVRGSPMRETRASAPLSLPQTLGTGPLLGSGRALPAGRLPGARRSARRQTPPSEASRGAGVGGDGAEGAEQRRSACRGGAQEPRGARGTHSVQPKDPYFVLVTAPLCD